MGKCLSRNIHSGKLSRGKLSEWETVVWEIVRWETVGWETVEWEIVSVGNCPSGKLSWNPLIQEDFDDLGRIDRHVERLVQLLKKTREIYYTLGAEQYRDIFNGEEIAASVNSEIEDYKEGKSQLQRAAHSQ